MKFTIQSGKAPPKKASAHRNQEIMLLVTSAAEVISTLRDGQFFVVEGSKGLKGGRCAGIVRTMNRAIKQAGREGGVIAYSSDDGVVVKHMPSGIGGEDDAPRAPAAQPAKPKATPIKK